MQSLNQPYFDFNYQQQASISKATTIFAVSLRDNAITDIKPTLTLTNNNKHQLEKQQQYLQYH